MNNDTSFHTATDDAPSTLSSVGHHRLPGIPAIPISIEAGGVYRLGDKLYTGRQLEQAVYCAHGVAYAYEIADIANGGDGSVDWADIDEAQRAAANAMGPEGVRKLVAAARVVNGFVAPVSRDVTPWLTFAETAEACAEGWSLFTHFGNIVELRLERIDCPDEGEGALPDDAAAWLRVWTRATALHQKVIGILKASSPAEHARIEAYVHELEARQALA